MCTNNITYYLLLNMLDCVLSESGSFLFYCNFGSCVTNAYCLFDTNLVMQLIKTTRFGFVLQMTVTLTCKLNNELQLNQPYCNI